MRAGLGPFMLALAIATLCVAVFNAIAERADRLQRTAEQEALDRIAFSMRHAPPIASPCGRDRCVIVEERR